MADLAGSTDPVSKIVDAVKALLDTPDCPFYADRSDDEPLDESERPGAIIRVPGIAFESYASQGMDLWRATLHIDFHSSGSAGETIDQQNRRAMARTIAQIAADRTLGGRLQSWESKAASASEQDGADVGCTIFESEIAFFVARDDPLTIIGQGGAHF